jgi:transcriptional regulator with PAS, ATPase and Fis domain
VLIQGESGTGKELVARAIHESSDRSEGPFIAINCAAFPETLVESELFGHERNAFTGATAQKKGKFEAASGGTIFLDEVGELTLSTQAKLLRVIQEREVERLGGKGPIRVDIRIVAATNRHLHEEVAAGNFRQDLYFRLKVLPITTPSLRERREDITLLAEFFLAKYSAEIKPHVRNISPEAMQILLDYDWPGNVRELENVIERAVTLASSGSILPNDLMIDQFETRTEPPEAAEGLDAMKSKDIENALIRAGGSVEKTAGILGCHPNSVYRYARQRGLAHLIKRRRGGGTDV